MSVRRRTSCGLFLLLIVVALGVRAAPVGSWQAEVLVASELDTGFRLLYELTPEEARAQFAVWQASHPEDPLGSASEAASYLFEECYRQGVLTSEFFSDNKLDVTYPRIAQRVFPSQNSIQVIPGEQR